MTKNSFVADVTFKDLPKLMFTKKCYTIHLVMKFAFSLLFVHLYFLKRKQVFDENFERGFFDGCHRLFSSKIDFYI